MGSFIFRNFPLVFLTVATEVWKSQGKPCAEIFSLDVYGTSLLVDKLNFHAKFTNQILTDSRSDCWIFRPMKNCENWNILKLVYGLELRFRLSEKVETFSTFGFRLFLMHLWVCWWKHINKIWKQIEKSHFLLIFCAFSNYSTAYCFPCVWKWMYCAWSNGEGRK